MIGGVGSWEILVILLVVLVLFGSDELPKVVRELGRMVGKIKQYNDKIRRELDEAIYPEIKTEAVSNSAEVEFQKQQLRQKFDNIRKSIPLQQRTEYSELIRTHLKTTDEYKNAKAIMIYLSLPYEVDTKGIISDAILEGKRIIAPYVNKELNRLGIANIFSLEKDLIKGAFGILEPRQEYRDNFFKSDLQLVICPGVAFDIYGGRLGRGKGLYDKFLEEIKYKIPIVGLAFRCQILDSQLPFAYHDVAMDQIITEDGSLLSRRSLAG